MARDWSDTKTLKEDIWARMALYGDNVAPIPFCMYQERIEGTNNLKWVVEIHVKVKSVTEFEVIGEDETFAGALRRAYLGLNNETLVLRNADKANAQFGIAV